MAVFCAAGAIPVPSVTRHDTDHRQPRYKLIDLGTFGGVTSYINPVGNGGPYMNGKGMVVGSSMTSIPIPPNQNGYPCPSPPDEVFHAMQWRLSGVTELRSLGISSDCGNALAINDRGETVGTSENGKLDLATGVLQLRAVMWKDGHIRNLGTLGGKHSFAGAINDQGEIVGFALNKIPDPYSLFDFGIGGFTSGTQTRAFLWRDGHMQDLGTLGGPDAWAVFVNEHSQVAGYSYTNSAPNSATGVPTVNPFLWTAEGGIVDLGTLGGAYGVPVGLNNRGQVIGISGLASDPAACLTGTDPENCHPFFWDGEKLIDLNTSTIGGNPVSADAITDAGDILGAECFPNGACSAYIRSNGVAMALGALPGDCVSEAFVMNSRGLIAGGSLNCNSGTIRAVLWEDGRVFDLNALISGSSDLLLVEANAINDRGEIAGNGFPAGCTDVSCTHAYVLIPCDHSNDEHGDDTSDSPAGTMIPKFVPANQGSANVDRIGLPSAEITKRIRGRSGSHRFLGSWPHQ
jgi:probable HAF family extracellular repeat protein